jgi:6-phosphofructokinase 2
MIYTLTFNPALDRTLSVEKVRPDQSNRVEKEERYPGGKGIDVSRVLTTLEVNNRALGLIGGFTGEELEGLLLNEGVACEFVRISGETRTNIIVNDLDSGKQTIFNAKGPEIRPYELMQMIHTVERLPFPETVVISGSLPPGVHPQIYRKLIEMLKAKGARVLLDADGDGLKMGIQGNPDIIKPNVHELGRLVGAELKGMGEIVRAARDVHERGVGCVLVSLGPRGMLMIEANAQYLASPPEVEVVNTIGAGDSAVAGFLFGSTLGKSHREALAFAVAAGTATAMRPGTALCRKEEVLDLVSQVKVDLGPRF